jgi:hypothetical protein
VSDDPTVDVNVDAYLSEAITVLDVAGRGEFDVGSIGEYAQRLDMLRRIIQQATAMRNTLELTLAEAMPESRMSEGGLRIVRERASRSYWKDASASERMKEDIEHQVATKLATDVATGEVDQMRRNVISHAIHELWAVLPAPSTLKAGARRFDLTLSDYRDYAPGFNIRISPIEEEPND